jgi:glycosyltransferase involved in cell wall biosynthesis
MKIAVWHNLASGGAKRALYYHVRGLVQRGHVLEAWCPPTADRKYLPLTELIPEHVIPFSWTAIRRHPFGHAMAAYRELIENLGAMDRHCRACADQINQRGYELLFANNCLFPRVTPIARYVRVPKVLYLQEPNRSLYEAMPELPWVALPEPRGGRRSLRYLRRFLGNLVNVHRLRVLAREELLNARAFDTILANSFYSRESILRAYGLDAKVCYLGVDTDLFVNQRRPREQFVVGLGSIDWHKRLDQVILAIAQLPEPRPDLIWIANMANPSLLEEMQQLARSASVRFKAAVGINDQDVVDLLNRAAMLLYAPRLEPFGFAPLEANACGLPVVAVAEGGVRETVVDGVNGLLVEDAPRAIAQAIQRLLADPGYASRLGSAGQELVTRRWSLSASIDRLEQRLTEALELPIADTKASRS